MTTQTADRMYEILKTIYDSTAVLNHLDVEYQKEMCAAIKEHEKNMSLSRRMTTKTTPELDTIICRLCEVLSPCKYTAGSQDFYVWKEKVRMLQKTLEDFANEIKGSAIEP